MTAQIYIPYIRNVRVKLFGCSENEMDIDCLGLGKALPRFGRKVLDHWPRLLNPSDIADFGCIMYVFQGNLLRGMDVASSRLR